MKKLLCIVLFSVSVIINATEKNEVNVNNVKQMNNENYSLQVEHYSKSMPDVVLGCGEQGNRWYNVWRNEGYTHREARRLRRAWVRKCRGGGCTIGSPTPSTSVISQ